MSNLNELAAQIYEANKEKGFWDQERNIGESLMLVVTELSEGLEAHRAGRHADLMAFEDNLPDVEPFEVITEVGTYTEYFKKSFKDNIKDTFEDELADSVIRLLDLCGGFGIDIQTHVDLKLQYNRTRPRLHGKKY